MVLSLRDRRLSAETTMWDHIDPDGRQSVRIFGRRFGISKTPAASASPPLQAQGRPALGSAAPASFCPAGTELRSSRSGHLLAGSWVPAGTGFAIPDAERAEVAQLDPVARRQRIADPVESARTMASPSSPVSAGSAGRYGR